MGEMREIVDLATVERLFRLLAVALPVMGALIGALVGARRGNVRRSLLAGVLVGLVGVLNWVLWRIFNAVTDRNGLDTVRNLFINLALFTAVGAAIGLGARRLLYRSSAEPEALPSTPERQD